MPSPVAGSDTEERTSCGHHRVVHRRASRPEAGELRSPPGDPAGHGHNAHQVLAEGPGDRPGTPTRQALERVHDLPGERLDA
jgi:hypothetical protein